MASKRRVNAVPGHFQTTIIKRFMDDKEFKTLMDRYEEVKFHRSFTVRPASQNDHKIAGHFKKVQSISLTAADLGVSSSQVFGALARVTAGVKA